MKTKTPRREPVNREGLTLGELDDSEQPYSKAGKQFNIIDHNDENVLGGSVPLNHCYINEYGAVQPGEKLPKDLKVGESTRAEYRMSMTKPTIYRIVRVQ
jgi:hypothetical protein